MSVGAQELKLFTENAKKYAKESGGGTWHSMFSVAARKEAATDWRDEFETEYDLGNYDHLLPKKYQKKG